MLVTDFTRECHRNRKFRKDMRAKGWEELGEGGGDIWRLIRGDRTYARIVDCVVDPGGQSVWVNIEPKRRSPYVWELPTITAAE